jgi:hypothetical protein
MRITISDGTDIILDKDVPDDAGLVEFDKHKETLLDTLRDGYDRGPKSKPFDADKAWHSLTALAHFHLRRCGAKEATIPAAARIERLRDIAKRLRSACRLIDRTMQSDFGVDLFQAWWEVTGSEYAKADGSFDPRDMERRFEQVLKGLAVLEKAAAYGAGHVAPSKRGKPPALSRDDIWNLARLYRDSTSSMPRANDGPFAKFVNEFLAALGRADDIEYGSLVEAIKGARQWALSDPVARKWGPSPFDKET